MKRFDTPAYIKPIIDEIRGRYKPVTDKQLLNYFHCELILDNPKTREFIAVREADKTFYYYSSSTRALLATVDDWKRAAETYTGELDRWFYQEERRIMEAIKAALIAEYTTPAASA